MSRRLDVELTSKRPDGTFTWRAAGARQPKGELDGSLLYEGAGVGDVVRAEAEFGIDGVTIVGVQPPREKRAMPETLELIGGSAEGGVTTQLVGKRSGRDRERPRSGRRGDDPKGRRRDRRRDGAKGSSRPEGRQSRRPRAAPSAPRPKRLRPRRIHRDAVLNELPDYQRPLARIVLRDGVPGVRQTVERQNVRARERAEPEIPPKVLEAVGERLLPRLRAAEWRDNAEAALAGIAEVDLRDIRKVVVGAENGARDEESRALAERLKTELAARVEAEHGKWLAGLNDLLNEGRTVRALRQSSRPPKAGSPLPPDLATRLTDAANSSMTAETSPERWATVLDAVAFSPVRQHVRPQALPTKITDELRATVRKLERRVPDIAALFTTEPET